MPAAPCGACQPTFGGTPLSSSSGPRLCPTPPSPAGTGRGWSRRQYLALVHLYAFEVLLPELKDPSGEWATRERCPPARAFSTCRRPANSSALANWCLLADLLPLVFS
jgi:hypothetical protein